MSRLNFNILLAEDNPNLGSLLKNFLTIENINVTLCVNGELALKIFFRTKFDLCLIDIMMPMMDGFTLVKNIRSKDKKVPIIIITAKSLKEDKLTGYELGIDDYIVKPFDEEELLWKIKAFVKRSEFITLSDKTKDIVIGNSIFNYDLQTLTLKNNVKHLTLKECELIHYLFSKQNIVLKREEILKDLWGENDYFVGRSLDVFITKIRKYFKEDDRISIENIFGVGFVFRIPNDIE